MSNISEFVVLGLPLEMPDGTCRVYPPSVLDYVQGARESNIGALLISQEDIWDMMVEKEAKDKNVKNNWEITKDIKEKALTPLDFILAQCYFNKQFLEQIENSLELFTKEPVVIIVQERKIVFTESAKDISDITNLRYIDENNFFIFQNLIREAIGTSPKEAPDPDENPRVSRIKAKGRLRDRIVQKRGKSHLSLGNLLVAVSCMGLGINLLNIRDVPYAAVSHMFHIGRLRENDARISRALSGTADPKKIKPTDWVQEIIKNQ